MFHSLEIFTKKQDFVILEGVSVRELTTRLYSAGPAIHFGELRLSVLVRMSGELLPLGKPTEIYM